MSTYISHSSVVDLIKVRILVSLFLCINVRLIWRRVTRFSTLFYMTRHPLRCSSIHAVFHVFFREIFIVICQYFSSIITLRISKQWISRGFHVFDGLRSLWIVQNATVIKVCSLVVRLHVSLWFVSSHLLLLLWILLHFLLSAKLTHILSLVNFRVIILIVIRIILNVVLVIVKIIYSYRCCVINSYMFFFLIVMMLRLQWSRKPWIKLLSSFHFLHIKICISSGLIIYRHVMPTHVLTIVVLCINIKHLVLAFMHL